LNRQLKCIVQLPRIIAVLAFLVVTAAHADDITLLRAVATNWLEEQNHWAFTQLVREYEGKELKQERLERYDPSKASVSRWRLISINGRRPAPGEWSEWSHRKNRPHHHGGASIAKNFDFANARIVETTEQTVRYELPLRNSLEWLFPVNKVELLVTINKAGPALEQVHARISEPFRVALGLERVLNFELDLHMAPPVDVDPARAVPSGLASAVVTRLGQRVEYFWSDFKHVQPHPDSGGDGS